MTCETCGTPEVGDRPTCRHCGGVLWRDWTLSDTDRQQVAEGLVAAMPSAGMRRNGQLDAVIVAHVEPSEHAAVRKLFRAWLDGTPPLDGERLVWASTTSSYCYTQQPGGFGSSARKNNRLLLTSHRLLIGTPPVGKARIPPPTFVYDTKDAEVSVVYIPWRLLSHTEPDPLSATVVLRTRVSEGEHRWTTHPSVTAGEHVGPMRWMVEFCVAMDLARSARAGQIPSKRSALIVDGYSAEESIAAWLSELGIYIEATRVSADGGIDLDGPEYVGQVRMTAGRMGPTPLQAIVGVGHVDGKRPLFFSKSGYTGPALKWAAKAGLPLYSFNAAGQVVPDNAPAERLLSNAEQRLRQTTGARPRSKSATLTTSTDSALEATPSPIGLENEAMPGDGALF